MIRWVFILGLCLEARLAAAETTAATNAPALARKDFDAFRIVAQRNIFNPNRSSRNSRSSETSDTTKTARSESFALVGTMLYKDGQFAFFDSSSANYRKVLKVGDSIAGYKIDEVSGNGVKLQLDDNTVEMAVGQQMNRQGDDQWKVSGKPAGETTSSGDASSSGSASSSSGDEDEIVKRLMKKREEEMQK